MDHLLLLVHSSEPENLVVAKYRDKISSVFKTNK